ncbi:perosamine synthetase [Desulfobaculum xiamenense]|uniref:Perosamine synthetase n=1 Tax=Desulfobaculum xiamenense TaxID=995050 RepID=A0A846QUI8_9BACT|nr:DegT/DnrJ/EryC1/StrS family aminotransferase [Desulfobaculum xiamenense]NJB69185.1 perosamine synthetase [Desulfobaculum xiamenense]
MDDFIPVSTPVFEGRERELLAQCIETGWISSEGPFVEALERGMAKRTGRAHGVAMSSGSCALQAAVGALNLHPGDEVIIPSFTIISCAAAVIRSGATPVAVDCDPRTWCMDVDLVRQAVTPRTRAVMPVHIYGLTVDMTRLDVLTAEYGLAMVEDAAEAHGQQCDSHPCGGFGTMSVFSFYPNKLITTGEGGMVLTDDEALAMRLRSMRNLCFEPQRRFVHDELGWNWRMSNVQAAIGVAQLDLLDTFVERKRTMGRRYDALLADIPGLERPLPSTPFADNAYWVYGVVLADEVPLDAVQAMRRLAERGIGTRPFFWPMHEQPVFRRMGLFADTHCPVSERIARRGFYIPSGLGLTEEQQERVAAALREVLVHA